MRLDEAGPLHRIIAGSYERSGIILTTDIESGEWDTILADDESTADFQSAASSTTHAPIVFTGPSRRTREAPMSNNHNR